MNLTDIQKQLALIMRGIDRKTTLTVVPSNCRERPGVTVKLAAPKGRQAMVEISEADLTAAETDLIQRSRIRTALKVSNDRMWAVESYIFSTKTERPKESRNGFYQSRPGGRR